MAQTYYNLDEGRSVLSSLCGLIPERSLRFSEALRIAELQASRLPELTAVNDGPVPSEVISELPRIRVGTRDLPTSGLSYWDGQVWAICLNRTEPATWRRFTLFHEYKHIIDHGRSHLLYTGAGAHDAVEQAEQAADYFAGCALMPKRLLKWAWGAQLQHPTVVGVPRPEAAKTTLAVPLIKARESRSVFSPRMQWSGTDHAQSPDRFAAGPIGETGNSRDAAPSKNYEELPSNRSCVVHKTQGRVRLRGRYTGFLQKVRDGDGTIRALGRPVQLP
jgi:hypothetical protein